MTLPFGPNSRKDRNKMPPQRSCWSLISCSGGLEIGGMKCLETTRGILPIVKSKPLRLPPLYPVRLVVLRRESAVFLGERWKCLLPLIQRMKQSTRYLNDAPLTADFLIFTPMSEGVFVTSTN
jgi:hypothetical protein